MKNRIYKYVALGSLFAATLALGAQMTYARISNPPSSSASITGIGPTGQTQTGATQTLATSTTGSDFTITATGNTQTFNLPDAGATARGLVNTTAQTFAGAKTLSSLFTATGGSLLTASTTVGGGATTTGLTVSGAATTSLGIIIGTAASAGVNTITDAATITVDWSQGNTAYVIIGATGRTVAFANARTGQAIRMFVVEDGTGSRTITTWPAALRWAGGTAPTLTTTASKLDICSFMTATTSTAYFGACSLNY